ncbi:hypothetical protein [Kitasatospora azatica]|uniref:hypothetical protein n=1 Tax=Kitasatospora azatica TaxID=58347 RepID=UPI00068FD97D|nr:hypothetical protein [Kitasatospora azatica]
MKRPVRVALWAALSAQSIWFLTHGADAFGVSVLVVLGGFAALSGRYPWTGVPVRLLMAADFLLSVGARFGAFGGPDSPGVTWGDFAHFTAYTRQVASFLPAGLAPTLAVLATIAETGLGLALLLGVRLRRTALGAACLLLSFGISMSVSLPVSEQFHYCVFALAAGMLDLSTADRYPLSLDRPLSATRAARATRAAKGSVPSSAPGATPDHG